MHELRYNRVGLALSGGSVRGLAHIGVYKALTEAGIRPAFVAGTSAGSIIGAAIAAGMGWKELERLARSVFWPKLLHGETLERFCERNLPRDFSDLRLPFAAIATALPYRHAVSLTTGRLASAISASCAMRVIRGRVRRDGHQFKDGGIACALPASACRRMGASFVISSDVWEAQRIAALDRPRRSGPARAPAVSGPLPSRAPPHESADPPARSVSGILAGRGWQSTHDRRR